MLDKLERKFGGERFNNPNNEAKNRAMNQKLSQRIKQVAKMAMYSYLRFNLGDHPFKLTSCRRKLPGMMGKYR